MKKLLFIAICVTIQAHLFGQSSIEGPDFSCPDDPVTYSAYWTGDEHAGGYYWKVINGTIIGANDQSNVKVKWNNVTSGSLSVVIYDYQGIHLGDAAKGVKIWSLAGVTPAQPGGSTSIPIGSVGRVSYSTNSINYPGTSNNVHSYEWEIPDGWTFSSHARGSSVTLQPDGGSGGSIRVRAVSHCDGFYSNWSYPLGISRYVPTPGAIEGAPDYVTCNDRSSMTLSVPAVSGATSYTWTKPSGWTGSSTTNTISLTPNGTTGGAVTVRANGFGRSSAVRSTSIPLKPFNPNSLPAVSGASLLCTSNSTFSVQNLPSGASVSWTVSPASLFAVDTGTGASFTTRASNATSSGQGTISAVVSGTCGQMTISKNVWIGKPATPNSIAVSGPNWNGQNQTCPGTLLELYAIDYINDQSYTSYNWVVQGATLLSNRGTLWALVKVPIHAGLRYVTFRVSAANSCGSSAQKILDGTSDASACGGGAFLMLSPNPTSDEVTITLENSENLKTYSSDANQDLQALITDFSGNEVYQGTLGKNGLKVNMKEAPKGIYLVRILGKDFEQTSRLTVR